jgi:hypothetical protein
MDQKAGIDAKVLFREYLAATLDDPETSKSFAQVRRRAKVTDPKEDIRSAVAGRRDAVIKSTDAYRAAFDAAIARLSEADQRVAAFRGRFKRVYRNAAILAAIAAVIGVIVALATSEPAWLLAGPVAALYGGYVPWSLMWFRTLHARRASERNLADRMVEVEAARQRYTQRLRQEVTAEVRAAINDRLRTFSSTFEIFDDRGLRKLVDRGREVSTTATAALRSLMMSLDSGSIGLSGPRGSGKTTLMHSFAEGGSELPLHKQRRGLVVAAPVRYDAREFVLHLYARVCARVLHPGGEAPDPPRRAVIEEARRIAMTRLLLAAGIVLAVVGAAMLVTHRVTPKGPSETGGLMVAVAALVLYAWLIVKIPGPTAKRISRALFERLPGVRAVADADSGASDDDGTTPGRKYTPEQLAEYRLEEIRFQQTLASSASGTLELPLGVKLGGEATLSQARVPWTLPEVVDAFRRYVRTLAETHYLVIGVDELDKMESDEAARRFLNDIKGVFGVEGCYYLVSVSEDAMSTFERRGLPFRDVFDSSFDAIQRVGYLTLDESRAVLESRVTGLSIPFQCFCHCLAGGLPRELIRVARELLHQASADGAGTLGELSQAVIGAEYRGKVAAAEVAARGLAGDGREWVLRWIQRHQSETLVVSQVRPLQAELLASPVYTRNAEVERSDDDRRLHDIAVELMAFTAYAGTVLQFFSDNTRVGPYLFGGTVPDPDRPRTNGKVDLDVSASAKTALALLARSRQRFAVSAWLALEDVERFRSQTWLDPWARSRRRRPWAALRARSGRNAVRGAVGQSQRCSGAAIPTWTT